MYLQPSTNTGVWMGIGALKYTAYFWMKGRWEIWLENWQVSISQLLSKWGHVACKVPSKNLHAHPHFTPNCFRYTHTRLEWIIWVIRQELNPVTCKLDGKQINQRSILRIMDVPETSSCRYAELIRLCIPYNQVASLDVVPDCMPRPPALVLGLERERTEEGKKREKFYIYLDVTHTHTRPEPGQPWKAKGRKRRTQTTGRRPEQRRGGRGNKRTSKTNLHGETDLTKTAHTPKPHDTLRRGTRGELGTKWGTSWWQTKNKTIN